MHRELSPQLLGFEADKGESCRVILLLVARTLEVSGRNIALVCERRAEDVTVKQRLSVT